MNPIHLFVNELFMMKSKYSHVSHFNQHDVIEFHTYLHIHVRIASN